MNVYPSVNLVFTLAFEPRHDKTNKMSVRPAKTQISLGICPVSSESLLCAQWVAKDPSFFHADSEDSDQTGRMPRLICLCWAHMPFCWFCRDGAHFSSLLTNCKRHCLDLDATLCRAIFRKFCKPSYFHSCLFSCIDSGMPLATLNWNYSYLLFLQHSAVQNWQNKWFASTNWFMVQNFFS